MHGCLILDLGDDLDVLALLAQSLPYKGDIFGRLDKRSCDVVDLVRHLLTSFKAATAPLAASVSEARSQLGLTTAYFLAPRPESRNVLVPAVVAESAGRTLQVRRAPTKTRAPPWPLRFAAPVWRHVMARASNMRRGPLPARIDPLSRAAR